MSEIRSSLPLLKQFEACLIALAEGDTAAYDSYEDLRNELLTRHELVPHLPPWVLQFRYSTQMWSFMKSRSAGIEPRLEFIRSALAPVHRLADPPDGTVSVLHGKMILWAKEVDASITFYQTVFGAVVLSRSPFVSSLQVGNIPIGIHNGGDGEKTWTGLAFQVDDVLLGAQAVIEGGGFVPSEPKPENGEPPHLAMCMDPDKNQFMLYRQR